jgi:hypothetical protein
MPMSFQLNNEQQMAINDSLLSLTERELKYLKDSWAETFSKKIFPFIDLKVKQNSRVKARLFSIVVKQKN